MLDMLQKAMLDGTVRISHVYIGHIKKDEDQKRLTHADALAWEDTAPCIQAVIEQHFYQTIDGEIGETLFPCNYHGQMLPVEKVTTAECDRTRNRPAVEILEAIRDLKGDDQHNRLAELGNALAYKVMAGGVIRNHLVGIAKFNIVPGRGAQPIPFSFATVIDLEDREEALLDDNAGTFNTQVLNNTIKRGRVSRAVLFPCLDDGGRESADLLVYARGNQGTWVRALEVPLQFSADREGKILMKLITQQASMSEVPHDLFDRMAAELAPFIESGLSSASVAIALEKALGYGIDRHDFASRWEDAFGDLGYRPAYLSLFAPALKMDVGRLKITLTPVILGAFRQVTINNHTFIAFAVPHQAQIRVGADLDLRIKQVDHNEIALWLLGRDA